MEDFIQSRLLRDAKMSVLDPIRKLRLWTFSTMIKTISVKCKDMEIPLKATRSLLGRIAIIMENRKIDLK